MMNKLPRKRLVAIITVALLLTGGGVAFAYWTATGAGTGSATTGTTSAIIVNQTSTVTGLTPDGTPAALSGTFTNNNSAPVAITGVTAAVTATSISGCLTSWYSIAGTITPSASQIAVGTVTTWSGATVQLVNSATVDQSICKTATITITYTVS